MSNNKDILSAIIGSFRAWANENTKARRLYDDLTERKFQVSDRTRRDPVWIILSRVKVGDILEVKGKRAHGSQLWEVASVVTQSGDCTHVVLKGCDDDSKRLTFSWKNYHEIGIRSIAFSSENED